MELPSQVSGNQVLEGLYFDGRSDKTLSNTVKGGINHPVAIVEEHVVLFKAQLTISWSHIIS